MLRETIRIFTGHAATSQRIPIANTITSQRTTILPLGWNIPGFRPLTFRLPPSTYSDAFQTMLASEDVLRRDWDQPEEDAAWADL